MVEAADHGSYYSVFRKGWYPRWALDHNDLDQFDSLLAGGHEIGSRSHEITYDAKTDAWIAHHEESSVFGGAYAWPV